jgi:hypothetical protein
MRYLSRISVSSFRRYLEIMSPTNPLLKDGPMPQPSPHEPLMEETLASIRRIIADDQALLASESGSRGEAPRPESLRVGFARGRRAQFRFNRHPLPGIVERLVSAEIERVARGE